MVDTRIHTPQVGEQAPDFTLNDTERQPISLHDYRGQTVVLVFFPAAFSSVCTKEVCAFRDSLAQLNRSNVQVLGISVDLPYSLREFRRAQNLNFPLLSDFDRVAISDYGVVDNSFNGYVTGVARRSVFVVDPNGAVAWEWLADSPGQQPDYTEVLRVAEGQGG
ncbi:MAG: peroxiredoxin [Chloroflexi bacterium]|nr:peroxiredoxin [Chloroflexota bacterium]